MNKKKRLIYLYRVMKKLFEKCSLIKCSKKVCIITIFSCINKINYNHGLLKVFYEYIKNIFNTRTYNICFSY